MTKQRQVDVVGTSKIIPKKTVSPPPPVTSAPPAEVMETPTPTTTPIVAEVVEVVEEQPIIFEPKQVDEVSVATEEPPPLVALELPMEIDEKVEEVCQEKSESEFSITDPNDAPVFVDRSSAPQFMHQKSEQICSFHGGLLPTPLQLNNAHIVYPKVINKGLLFTILFIKRITRDVSTKRWKQSASKSTKKSNSIITRIKTQPYDDNNKLLDVSFLVREAFENYTTAHYMDAKNPKLSIPIQFFILMRFWYEHVRSLFSFVTVILLFLIGGGAYFCCSNAAKLKRMAGLGGGSKKRKGGPLAQIFAKKAKSGSDKKEDGFFANIYNKIFKKGDTNGQSAKTPKKRIVDPVVGILSSAAVVSSVAAASARDDGDDCDVEVPKTKKPKTSNDDADEEDDYEDCSTNGSSGEDDYDDDEDSEVDDDEDDEDDDDDAGSSSGEEGSFVSSASQSKRRRTLEVPPGEEETAQM